MRRCLIVHFGIFFAYTTANKSRNLQQDVAQEFGVAQNPYLSSAKIKAQPDDKHHTQAFICDVLNGESNGTFQSTPQADHKLHKIRSAIASIVEDGSNQRKRSSTLDSSGNYGTSVYDSIDVSQLVSRLCSTYTHMPYTSINQVTTTQTGHSTITAQQVSTDRFGHSFYPEPSAGIPFTTDGIAGELCPDNRLRYCTTGSYLCPASLDYGCCPDGYTCGLVNCRAPLTPTSYNALPTNTLAATTPIPPPPAITSPTQIIITNVPYTSGMWIGVLGTDGNTRLCTTGSYLCPASLDYGCCPTNHGCGLTDCPAVQTGSTINATAGVTFTFDSQIGVLGWDGTTRYCKTGSMLCPASLNYGCCPQGLVCGATDCHARQPTFAIQTATSGLTEFFATTTASSGTTHVGETSNSGTLASSNVNVNGNSIAPPAATGSSSSKNYDKLGVWRLMAGYGIGIFAATYMI